MRIRTIKPDFFKDEDLAEIPHKARLLALGLLCLADGHGRLEDRPRKIRAEVFPYEAGSIEDDLQALHDIGFIIRYSADGKNVIQVRNFRVHQRISGKEASFESNFPERGSNGEATVKQRGSNDCFTNVQEREKEKEREKERTLDIVEDGDAVPDGPSQPNCPTREIVDLYNAICGESMPKAKVKTPARDAAIRRLWAFLKRDLTNIESFFYEAIASDFLSGRNGKWKGCNLDWLCKTANSVKVVEGNYKNQAKETD